jgi:hypothetical protein
VFYNFVTARSGTIASNATVSGALLCDSPLGAMVRRLANGLRLFATRDRVLVMVARFGGGCRGRQDHRRENEKQQKDTLGHTRPSGLKTLSHDFVNWPAGRIFLLN